MGRILTRGLTGSAGEIVVQGVGVALVRIVRGGRSAASRAIKDLIHDIKISVMLIETNGKELVKPIINKVRKTFSSEDNLTIRVLPKKLIDEINILFNNIPERITDPNLWKN